MIKYILTLLLISTINIFSQPVIKHTDLVLPLPNKPAKIKYEGGLSLEKPLTGENVNWNFDNINFAGEEIIYSYYEYDNNPNYPDATAQSNFNSSFGSFTIEGSRNYYKNTENGSYDLGYEILEKSFSLTQQTFGPNDKLKVLNSVNYFGNAIDFQYPLTYGKEWTYNKRGVTKFELTVALFQLNNTPGEVVQNITSDISVVGWGNLTMGIYNNIPALLVKSVQTQIDSIYLNNEPAPATLLNFFNLQQGNTRVFTTYYYLISDGQTAFTAPAATMYASADGELIQSIEANQESYLANSIKNDNVKLNTYPNPTTNSVNIDFIKEDNSTWNIEIMNINGQILTTQNVNSNGNITETFDTENYANGMYIISIKNQENKIIASKEFIKK